MARELRRFANRSACSFRVTDNASRSIAFYEKAGYAPRAREEPRLSNFPAGRLYLHFHILLVSFLAVQNFSRLYPIRPTIFSFLLFFFFLIKVNTATAIINTDEFFANRSVSNCDFFIFHYN